MRQFFAALMLSFGALGMTPVLADGHGHHRGMIKVDNAWTRATIGNSKNGAVYMNITNMGKKDIVITSAQTDVSERAELHTHIKENNVMKMRPVEGGIRVPAGGMTELKPGGLHVMIMRLKKPLKKGEHFMLGINTSAGHTQKVKVKVGDVMSRHGKNHKMEHHGHDKMQKK